MNRFAITGSIICALTAIALAGGGIHLIQCQATKALNSCRESRRSKVPGPGPP